MIKLNYAEKGHGEPFILLHGNGENNTYFRHQIKDFAPYFHVIAIDSRGHGKTERGENEMTLIQMREDLKNFMDKHNIKKADILGFSDGANIAMLFALKYPENVNKLILNGGNIFYTGLKSKFRFAVTLSKHILNLFVVHKDFRTRRKELIKMITDEPDLKPKDLKKIEAETLVISGTNDLVYKEHTELIAKSIPNSKLVFIPGDHFVARKNFKAFDRAVLDFLKN